MIVVILFYLKIQIIIEFEIEFIYSVFSILQTVLNEKLRSI